MPLALHPDPKSVAFIGAATGITASSVLDFRVEDVVAMEPIPGVVHAVPLFDRWNRSFWTDPRVQLVIADGRSHLLGTKQRLDVIVSAPVIPWLAGTGDPYTLEHFQICHRRLADGGMFAQWLPAYRLTLEELRVITASMLEAFPAVTLWRDGFDPSTPLLCLIAFRDRATVDPGRIELHCKRLAETGGLPAPLLSDPAGLQMLYVCGDAKLRGWAKGASINTDTLPIIEYRSPKSLNEPPEKKAEAALRFVRQFRPREWCFTQPLVSDRSANELFRAADLMHDANVALMRSNFEQESRMVLELAQLAGDIRGVAEKVVAVALRYRRRNMNERSERLLTALIGHDTPPVAALVALADKQQQRNNDAEAIALLERAVQQAPGQLAIRRKLVELLRDAGQFGQAQPHLETLLESTPDDPYLRLDLAHTLDQQQKPDEARQQLAEFREWWDGTDSESVWRYLRRLGLGRYIDRPPPASSEATRQDEPPPKQQKEE